jgi:hypothetical protein
MSRDRLFAVDDGCGDAGPGCGREPRQGNVGEIVLAFEDEEEAVDLPRMRATMTTKCEMAPATKPFGWREAALQHVESPPGCLAAREHLRFPLS